MLKTNIVIAIFAVVAILSNIPFSESTLWDLIVSVNIENEPLIENENPIVSGIIVDHAGKPVTNAEVQIRSGINTIITSSNDQGVYYYEFNGLILLPGEHIVNVIATSQENKVGLASEKFIIKGALSASSHTAKLLETSEAAKYLNSSPEDFEFDPMGMTLYNYYQELQAQYFEEEEIQKKVDEQKSELEETRAISIDLAQKIIDEENPGAGIFSGYKYDTYVANLHPDIKDLIVKQMNYTVNIFEQAQNAMNDVLADGGTYQEARQAYYEKATISRETMEQITYGVKTNETSIPNTVNSTESEDILESSNATDTGEQISEEIISLNGTTIQVGLSGTTILLNVNGTLVEFLMNGTEIIQITNST